MYRGEKSVGEINTAALGVLALSGLKGVGGFLAAYVHDAPRACGEGDEAEHMNFRVGPMAGMGPMSCKRISFTPPGFVYDTAALTMLPPKSAATAKLNVASPVARINEEIPNTPPPGSPCGPILKIAWNSARSYAGAPKTGAKGSLAFTRAAIGLLRVSGSFAGRPHGRDAWTQVD